MKTVFVDANVFIRFFTEDDEKQCEKAEALFKGAAEGKVQLVTGPPVFFEIAWTLKAAYKVTQQRVIEILTSIVSFGGLTVTDQDLVLQALELAQRTGQDFADSYIAAAARGQSADVATFNTKHFKRLNVPLYTL